MENTEKKVWDVNILAIYLVEDHPGNKYVTPVVEEGLKGAYTPILLDILPVRAYWIMERKWGIKKEEEAARAVTDFLRKYETPRLVPLRKETLLEAFKLSKELGHDVYDCVYLALARQEGATTIITTDTDFEKLCEKVGIKYENPIPPRILRRFQAFKQH